MENLNLRRFEQKANNKEGERRCKRVGFRWRGHRGYICGTTSSVGERSRSNRPELRGWPRKRGRDSAGKTRPESRNSLAPSSSLSPPTPSPIFFIFHRLKGESRRGWKKKKKGLRGRKAPRRGSLNKNRVYPGRVSPGSRVWIVSTRKEELTTAWAWRREKNRTFLM